MDMTPISVNHLENLNLGNEILIGSYLLYVVFVDDGEENALLSIL